MRFPAYRSWLLAFAWTAVLAGEALAQGTANGGGDPASKLKTDERNLGHMTAKMQEDIRNAESTDEQGRPRHVVIMTGQNLLEGYTLMPRESYEHQINALAALGKMTSQQAERQKSDTLAMTKAFPQEARKILERIAPKLAVTQQELGPLSAGTAAVALPADYEDPNKAVVSSGAGASGDETVFLSDIPSVGGTVTSFRFFTADGDLPPPQGVREYQTRFSKASLKTVYYEFSVKYAIDNPATFSMTVTWMLNGRAFVRQDLPFSKPRDWNTSSRTYGHGHRESGMWEIGKYDVSVEVDGRKVAANRFVVY